MLAAADSHIEASRIRSAIANAFNLKPTTHYNPGTYGAKPHWVIVAGQRLNAQKVAQCRALVYGYVMGRESVSL